MFSVFFFRCKLYAGIMVSKKVEIGCKPQKLYFHVLTYDGLETKEFRRKSAPAIKALVTSRIINKTVVIV